MKSEASFIERKTLATVFLVLLMPLLALGASSATNALIGWSETALHEIDGLDFSVSTLAPPYSTIHAQFVSGGLLITNPAGITVTYQALADATGSINTTSHGKGNFYQYAQALFDVALAPDQGLGGSGMPGTNNQPQPLTFDPAQNCFSARGIPITPYDDQGQRNNLPMMRLVARDSANNILATADIVLPVSDQMDCRACHASGSQTAARPPSGWAWQIDPQRDYKLNILQSHDDHQLGSVSYTTVLNQVGYNPAGLVATVVRDGRPVLCVRCHLSNALSGSGAPAMRPLTQLIHTKHAYTSDPQSGAYLTSMTNSSACLVCHAGPQTSLVRGVHHNTINPDGSFAMQCESCHGSISAVGTPGRQGWLDEPACQSCHTGTAVNNGGAPRFTSVFTSIGQVRQPLDLTYATQTNVPATGLQLFRVSQGHGGLNCVACHGPAHAEWLSSQANDNVQSQALQNPAGGGVLTSCSICHVTTITNRTSGPHGMHPVDSLWAAGHDQGNRSSCQNCHGTDYLGTSISWAQGNRSYAENRQGLWQGYQIGCYTCHAGPNGTDGGMANPQPTVLNLSTNTAAGIPVSIALVGSSYNGGPVSFRVVSQPVHGTVSVTSNTATFFPDPSFVGSDSFTYAAWDGAENSNLGTVALTTSSGTCVLSASALAPTAAFPGSAVPFRAIASLSQCSNPISYDWDFGDGTPHATGTNVSHSYTLAGDYNWVLNVTAGAATQTVRAVVTISPTLGPPLILTATPLGFLVNLSWPADSVPTSLETATDLGQPYAWQLDVDPVYFDGTNNNVQIFFPTPQQLYRVRRVP